MVLIAVLLLVFVISLTVTGMWLRMANARHWLDRPNHRSSHAVPTPKSGGAGFVLAFSIYVLLMFAAERIGLQHLLLCAAGLVLAGTGFADDLRDLGIRLRIGVQILVAALAVALLAELPAVAFPWGSITSPWILWPLLVCGLVWLINLYNFMDGIDAMAAMEAVYLCLALAWFASGISMPLTWLALGLAVAVSGFLYFNLPPARIFMGDLGSNYLGYMAGMLGLIAMTAQVVNLWTILVLLGIFIVDTTATLISRMWSGAVWYHSHRSHAYQQAALRYGSHAAVVGGAALINLFWLLPMAWLTTKFEQSGLWLTVLAWLPLFLLRGYFRRNGHQQADVQKAQREPAVSELRNGRVK